VDKTNASSAEELVKEYIFWLDGSNLQVLRNCGLSIGFPENVRS
jgi:hypothetical protein